MLKIDLTKKSLSPIGTKKLTELGIKERQHLQEMIAHSFPSFAQELGLELMLVGKEFFGSDAVDSRLDLLAMDKQGRAVVIELKRRYDDNQLYQALAYAAMISDWIPSDFFALLAKMAKIQDAEAEKQIESFVEDEPDVINLDQRIILLAEDFDFQTLVTAKWLHEKHEVDISCYRLVVTTPGQDCFLTCQPVYPTPGLEEHAVNRSKRSKVANFVDWEAAIARVKNPAVADFFHKELAAKSEENLDLEEIFFRLDGKRRFHAKLRTKHAYFWQYSRFEGDVAFWQSLFGNEVEIQEVNKSTSLRFSLDSMEQFSKFKQALTGSLATVVFTESGGS